MKKLGYLALLGLFALPAFAATETFTDVPVVDSNCSKKVADNPDTHTRACALKCESSGYGIITSDKKFLKFDAAFTAQNVAGEVAYLKRASSRGFERPYGWGWLLKLQAELLAHADSRWATTLQPLATVFAERFVDFLPKAHYPIRTGVHSSTAFAIALAQDYAVAAGDIALTALFTDKVRAWYLDDRDAPAWEPSGDEFLSATLMEAECLRRLLPPAEFAPWLKAFLPRAAQRYPATLFTPAVVSDRSDGKIAHLDGLNFSRAWCWRELAATLPAGDPLAAVAEATAREHLAASLPHVAGDYMGEHWLASFALLALTAGEGLG